MSLPKLSGFFRATQGVLRKREISVAQTIVF
jgi:hypothetical protein